MRTDEIDTRASRSWAPGPRPTAGPVAWGLGKIQARHHQRLAVVYVRRSTPQQVHEHRESADLQYDLRRRATELGWPADRATVIDEDRGAAAGPSPAGRASSGCWPRWRSTTSGSSSGSS
jgi:hypothetical protein